MKVRIWYIGGMGLSVGIVQGDITSVVGILATSNGIATMNAGYIYLNQITKIEVVPYGDL